MKRKVIIMVKVKKTDKMSITLNLAQGMIDGLRQLSRESGESINFWARVAVGEFLSNKEKERQKIMRDRR